MLTFWTMARKVSMNLIFIFFLEILNNLISANVIIILDLLLIKACSIFTFIFAIETGWWKIRRVVWVGLKCLIEWGFYICTHSLGREQLLLICSRRMVCVRIYLFVSLVYVFFSPLILYIHLAVLVWIPLYLLFLFDHAELLFGFKCNFIVHIVVISCFFILFLLIHLSVFLELIFVRLPSVS